MTTLQKQGVGMMSMLTVQYLLGVTTTLFVKFPENEHGGRLWRFAWTQLPLVLHIIIGLLLLSGSLVLLIRTIYSKDKTWIIAASVAFGAIIVAVIGGVFFIPTQTDAYSFIMASSFIIALLAYFFGIYVSKN